MEQQVLGLIAGSGRLPVLIARGMKESGARVVVVGLADHYDPGLPAISDEFHVAGLYRIGRWIRILRRCGARRAVLAGRVSKKRMHDPLRVFRHLPDLRAARLWYRRLRRDRRNSAVLAAIADELGGAGIELVDSTSFISGHLADSGLMTRKNVSAQHAQDIAEGWPVLSRLVGLDIGQAIAICRGRVIAVESLEGTDAMIERAGHLDGVGWTLLKAPAEDHDMRFDVPAIGEVTIKRLARARAGCVALRAGQVIMIDKPKVIETAERAGISIIGIDSEGPGPSPSPR